MHIVLFSSNPAHRVEALSVAQHLLHRIPAAATLWGSDAELLHLWAASKCMHLAGCMYSAVSTHFAPVVVIPLWRTCIADPLASDESLAAKALPKKLKKEERYRCSDVSSEPCLLVLFQHEDLQTTAGHSW